MTGEAVRVAASNSSPENVFPPMALLAWVESLLLKMGVPQPRAQIVADSLVAAELKGIASHGLSRLGIYVQRLKLGLVDAAADVVTIEETASTLVLDAQNGFGQPAASQGIEMAIAKARLSGACVVAIRNSTHFGTAGYFAELAAKQGFIAIVTTNSAARMAPWGGKDAAFGTNPLAIGVPSEAEPIVLDMSTSVAALGRIINAEKAGHEIPESWAQDREGRPTNSPTLALEGTLSPIAGPKGSGLAFMLDVLSGLLSGARYGPGVGSLYRDLANPEKCGHFLIVLDVNAFMPLSLFTRILSDYAAQVRANTPLSNSQPVVLPGELGRERAAKARQTGICLPGSIYSELLALADAHGVAFPAPERTATRLEPL